MKEPFVAIVIPNHNSASVMYKGKPILKSCIESLGKTSYKNYRIIIADNNSTDNSREMVNRYGHVDLAIKKTKERFGGIARTNNFGIKYALKKYKPDYILMYNTDMLVEDGLWLSKLVELAESDSSTGMVGCKLLFPNGRIQHAGMVIGSDPHNRGWGERDGGQYDKVEEVSGITGALALIRGSVFRKVGFFDENFYNGMDDADFCIRVRDNGFKILYDGEVSIVHFEGFASTNSPNQRTRDDTFYGYQVSYAYFAYKDFTAVKRGAVLLQQLSRCFFEWKGSSGSRGLSNIKLRDRKLWRLGVSLKAMAHARKAYNEHPGLGQ